MNARAVRWAGRGAGVLITVAAGLIAPGAAPAAIPTYTITVAGLPATAAWGSTYDVTVNYAYTWSDSMDKPEDGATLSLLEVDPSTRSDVYATKELPAPANGGNSSGTWSGSALFKGVNLASAMDADDTDGVLEIKGRFVEHSPLQDYNRDSAVYDVDAVPGTPASLTVPTKSESGNYSVDWGMSAGAVSYELQRKTDSLGIWGVLYTGSAFSFSESSSPGHVYYYRVRGVNSGGNSAWRTPANGCLVPLGIPLFIVVPAMDPDGAFTIIWGTSSGATGYELQEKVDGASLWLTVYTGAGTSKVLSGRLPDRTYYYRVQGIHDGSTVRSDWRTGANGIRILNPGVLAFKTGSVSVVEGTPQVRLKVARTGGTAGAATVKYATLGKSALAGQDFTARSGTLSWADGDATAKTIRVPILDDADTESDELFKVRLFDATGGVLGYPRLAKVKILGNVKGAASAVPLAQALDNEALAWTTKDMAAWTGQAGLSAGGDAAAMSGAGAGERVSWLETVVTGPGLLAFDWQLITGQAGEALILMDNGTVLAALNGPAEWGLVTLPLGGGPHTLRWTFIGGVDGEEPAGAGFLDHVRWTASP